MTTRRLPEHPDLRQAAEALENGRLSGEIYDHKWRIVFISTELARIVGLDPDDLEQYYGISPIVRDVRYPREWRTDIESARSWWAAVAPTIRRDVPPEDPDFESVFGNLAEAARGLEPNEFTPVISTSHTFSLLEGVRQAWLGSVRFVYVRLHDASDEFIGVLVASRPEVPDSLMARLARGELGMFARMDELREPARRPSAILFADLAGSGLLSRQLSSRAYFELIRSLTDLIDAEVATAGGILGKHAGDGASALFVAGRDDGGESAAARAAITAARAIREQAGSLGGDGVDVQVKVSVHWGATIFVGQVSTGGRLEVTALGDEMNECARIESAARGGQVLASKSLIERLDPADAETLKIDPDALSYQLIADLSDGEKVLRDAGAIAVVEL